MSLLPCVTPAPPDGRLDWTGVDGQFQWIRELKGCPQNPVYHGEGDVWIHVKMVCEALIGMKEWRSLPDSEREILFAAAVLHDVAKPACTRTEDGRITSRGHSQRGAIQARKILWEHAASWKAREDVCALVRFHQTPFHLIERPDAERTLRLASQSARCDLLTILAKADALGRYCDDQNELLTQIGLFEELCREQGCLTQPSPFPSSLSRFEYFRSEDRDPQYEAHDESKCQVILMSGLPGAGKDTWIRAHAADRPMISLDDIREEIDAEPTGNQGAVVQEAKERARVLLRQGTGFVWNATNLARDVRKQLIDLFTGYRARVKIVYVEAEREILFRQNRERERSVPESAIHRMMGRWDVPGVWEAPEVEWWGTGGGTFRKLGEAAGG